MKITTGLNLYGRPSAAAPVFNPYEDGFFTTFWNWPIDYAANRIFQDAGGSTLVSAADQPLGRWVEGMQGAMFQPQSETSPTAGTAHAVYTYDAGTYETGGYVAHTVAENYLAMWRVKQINAGDASLFGQWCYFDGEVVYPVCSVRYYEVWEQIYFDAGNEATATMPSGFPAGQWMYVYASRYIDGETCTYTLGQSADFGETWVTGSTNAPTTEANQQFRIGEYAASNSFHMTSFGYGATGATQQTIDDQIAGVSAYWRSLFSEG